MPRMLKAFQVNNLERDVPEKGACRKVGQHLFRDSFPAQDPGDCTTSSTSTAGGARSGQDKTNRGVWDLKAWDQSKDWDLKGSGSLCRKVQKTRLHMLTLLHEERETFTWRARAPVPRLGMLTYKKVPTQSSGGIPRTLGILSPRCTLGWRLVMPFPLLSDLPLIFLFLPSLFLFFYWYYNYYKMGKNIWQFPLRMCSLLTKLCELLFGPFWLSMFFFDHRHIKTLGALFLVGVGHDNHICHWFYIMQE